MRDETLFNRVRSFTLNLTPEFLFNFLSIDHDGKDKDQ